MTAASRPITETLTGGLLGVAVGDALGATVEFQTPTQIAARYGTHRNIIGGGAFNWRPGQGTDDTDLTLAVIDGYLNHTPHNQPIVASVANQMLAWYRTNPPDIGATTRHALNTLSTTGDPTTSGATTQHSCGNGSLMRALPTALIQTNPTHRRREATQISAITHAHPLCTDSCVAYTEIAAALINGATPTQAIHTTTALPLEPEVRHALAINTDTPVTELSTTGYVIDSLTCAIWALQQPTSFEDTLIALVNRGNDADTTAAIAGGLRGLLDGPNNIPQRWQQSLETPNRFVDIAHTLTSHRQQRPRADG